MACRSNAIALTAVTSLLVVPISAEAGGGLFKRLFKRKASCCRPVTTAPAPKCYPSAASLPSMSPPVVASAVVKATEMRTDDLCFDSRPPVYRDPGRCRLELLQPELD